MSFDASDLIKIGVAMAVGAAIGAEREYRDKSAGFRTLVLICVGSCLFTMLSIDIGGADRNAARIAAQIVSGIGFLGAGVIMREGGTVTGLTTAAMIWLTAALGMGIGAGRYLVSLVGGAAVLLVLWLFPLIESRIDALREARSYRLIYPLCDERSAKVAQQLRECGLAVFDIRHARKNSDLVLTVRCSGPHAAHEELVRRLLADGELREMAY